ncbi:hypothetical protein T484DRAFT_1848188 [Baffinella frigidus]|nr:hypothetical protein T484DRAFT_1848188 [Cryptophyta sp. CCMP2293]
MAGATLPPPEGGSVGALLRGLRVGARGQGRVETPPMKSQAEAAKMWGDFPS